MSASPDTRPADVRPADARPVVVVGTDPLCGWCFGIVDALGAARRELTREVRFEVACGGLVVGERVRQVRHDEAYLRAGLATVAATTGRRASDAYLEGLLVDGTWVSDSEPVVRAVVLARDTAGDDAALDLSSALSDTLYSDGLAPDDPQVLSTVADRLGLDGAAFVQSWGSEAARAATAAEMARARALGVQTYPSLLLRVQGGLVPLVAGYASAPEIVATVRGAVASVAAAA